jgi:2,4-diaminopentanoate dehydrogenase
MDKLRVVQWNTGKVGKLALRAMLDDPGLELVSVYAHSPEKQGMDAGALCGRPDTGVKATNSIDAIIAARPDVVVYTPFTGDVDELVKLLENGINVLSTNLLFHVGGVRGEVKDRLQAAGERGGASIYITGINPGWINSMAVAATAICNRVDCVSIYESADCSGYESPETWNFFRMGQHGVTDEVIEAARTWLVMFKDAAERMAEGLGIALDDVEFYCDYATAAERVDLGWFLLDKGTNAALRAGWNGKAGGKTRVRTQVTWYLTKKLAEGWDIDDREYHLVIEGAPRVDLHMHFTSPDPSPVDGPWDTTGTTAYATVNAIRQIKAARPGVLTLHDIGLPYAPAGAWEKAPPLA